MIEIEYFNSFYRPIGMNKEELQAEIDRLSGLFKNALAICSTTDWGSLHLCTGNPNLRQETIAELERMKAYIAEKIEELEKL